MGKLDPQRKWNEKHTTNINIRLMDDSDAEIIAWWKAQPKKAETFRRMVRQQMQTEEAVRWLRENPEKNEKFFKKVLTYCK